MSFEKVSLEHFGQVGSLFHGKMKPPMELWLLPPGWFSFFIVFVGIVVLMFSSFRVGSHPINMQPWSPHSMFFVDLSDFLI